MQTATMNTFTITIALSMPTDTATDVKALRAENKDLSSIKKETRGWIKDAEKVDPKRIQWAAEIEKCNV